MAKPLILLTSIITAAMVCSGCDLAPKQKKKTSVTTPKKSIVFDAQPLLVDQTIVINRASAAYDDQVHTKSSPYALALNTRVSTNLDIEHFYRFTPNADTYVKVELAAPNNTDASLVTFTTPDQNEILVERPTLKDTRAYTWVKKDTSLNITVGRPTTKAGEASKAYTLVVSGINRAGIGAKENEILAHYQGTPSSVKCDYTGYAFKDQKSESFVLLDFKALTLRPLGKTQGLTLERKSDTTATYTYKDLSNDSSLKVKLNDTDTYVPTSSKLTISVTDKKNELGYRKDEQFKITTPSTTYECSAVRNGKLKIVL